MTELVNTNGSSFSPIFPDEIWILICSYLDLVSIFLQFATISKNFSTKIVFESVTQIDLSLSKSFKTTIPYQTFFHQQGILKKFVNLTSLVIAHNNSIRDDDIKNLLNLTTLNLDSNELISASGIKHLTNLTLLNLQESPITGSDVDYLFSFGNITSKYWIQRINH
jgi:Leucine-rich repeat (LRR) protein